MTFLVFVAVGFAGWFLCWLLGKATNPACGAVLLNEYLTTSSTVNVAYGQAVLNCSAACEMIEARSTTTGGCTALTAQNLQINIRGDWR